MKIPFARVDCSGNEVKYVKEVLESGWLTTAGKAQELEKRFGRFVGAGFACAVNSCTAALHLALEAVGVGPKDKVIVPTMTFTASAEIVRYLGGDPIFVDVDYGTRMLRPSEIDRYLEGNDKIKAVMVVHFGGQTAPLLDETDNEGLLSICKRNGVCLIEDAAHAFPAYCTTPDQKAENRQRRPIGSVGDVTCFSFYANKTITTGEGGMIVTNDQQIADRARIMRLHGINRDIWNRFTDSKANWEYDVVAPGYKYNMPDVNAAIGLAQLERAEEMRLERQRVAEFYFDRLSNIECIDLPEILVPFEDHAWHLFCIVLKPDSPIARNDFIEKMADAGIGTSVHYKPLHRMTYYRERYKLNPEDFPNSEKIWKGTVSLPIYPGLKQEELEYITSTIRSLLC